MSLRPRPAADRFRDGGGFFVLVGLVALLIVLGALVRANEAGLACPDWPLCFGDVIPEMNLEVAFEWSHRVVASVISLVFAALAFVAWRAPTTPAAARRGIAIAAGLLAVQILLGALTVWLLVAPWTVTAHLIVGNGFCVACLMIGCALRDNARGRPGRPTPAPRARRLVQLVATLLAFQMVLGGLVASSFAGLACPEWPTCNGGVWFPSLGGSVGMHLLHRFNGYALVAAIAFAAVAARNDRPLARLGFLLLGLGIAQIAVGVANVLLGLPNEVTGLHSALATAIVLTTSLMVRDLFTRSEIPL
jgi:heme A synthase